VTMLRLLIARSVPTWLVPPSGVSDPGLKGGVTRCATETLAAVPRSDEGSAGRAAPGPPGAAANSPNVTLRVRVCARQED
jgi:hypothetical protein